MLTPRPAPGSDSLLLLLPVYQSPTDFIKTISSFPSAKKSILITFGFWSFFCDDSSDTRLNAGLFLLHDIHLKDALVRTSFQNMCFPDEDAIHHIKVFIGYIIVFVCLQSNQHHLPKCASLYLTALVPLDFTSLLIHTLQRHTFTLNVYDSPHI